MTHFLVPKGPIQGIWNLTKALLSSAGDEKATLSGWGQGVPSTRQKLLPLHATVQATV